jgi:hypothetical protein
MDYRQEIIGIRAVAVVNLVGAADEEPAHAAAVVEMIGAGIFKHRHRAIPGYISPQKAGLGIGGQTPDVPQDRPPVAEWPWIISPQKTPCALLCSARPAENLTMILALFKP